MSFLIYSLGFDLKVKDIEVDGEKLRLQIWDTVGQEKYQSLTKNCYNGVDGVFVVFDLTYQNSFENVTRWLTQLKKHSGDNVSIILIGNKSDLIYERVVTEEMIRDLQKELQIPYIEVSAKDGTNVKGAFLQLAREVKPKAMSKPRPSLIIKEKENSNISFLQGCCKTS